MRRTFQEQFDLNQEKIQDIWKKALVVFDTNILLNLYRYNKETCDDLIKYMKTFTDRLWMPFQVGWEYNNNRIRVAYQYQNAYCELTKVIEGNRKAIETFFQKFPHHPQLSLKVFFEHYDNYEKQLQNYIEELKGKDRKYFDEDAILETLAEIYDGKVGEDYSEESLKEIYKEGEKRYKSKVPPGYKDDTQDKRAMGDRYVYGDYIVWRQILDKAENERKDIIFVSDDLKEDWILEIHGKKKGLRKELIKEFYDKTGGNTILIYTQERFLEYAKTNEKADIKEDTIKEVKTVHHDMMKYYHEYVRSYISGTCDLGRMYTGLEQFVPKSILDNNALLSTLDNYKILSDSLKLQTERLQGIIEPFSRYTKGICASDYLTQINNLRPQIDGIHKDLSKSDYNEPNNLFESAYPFLINDKEREF